MIKKNLWKIVSFIGIMLSLIVILYLVVLYKVTWETRDFNTYLYFYDCNGVVCNSTTKPKDIKYNKIICDGDCPYVSTFIDNIVVLTKDDVSWLYDYKTGEIYNNKYTKYELIENGNFIVTDKNSKQGIMNREGELITLINYSEIIDYSYGLVVYKEDGKYGIDYDSGEEVIPAKYNEIILIDNTMYAALNDNNKYQIYNVVNDAPKNNVKYDYIWSFDNLLLVIKDKQLDILNHRLESNLLMKIKTYLGYTKKSERESLKIKYDDSFIYFNVNVSNTEYVGYKYDIVNKKISKNN